MKDNILKGNNVIGLKVISIHDGTEISDVKDLIYDPSENSVRALLIDSGGFFSDAKVILTQDISSIGKDAVMVDSANVIKKAEDVDSKVAGIAKEDQYLTKTKIITQDGIDLGSISDIYFDDVSGKVIEFEVSQGMIKNIQSGTKTVRVTDIITVGKDATIVSSYTESKFEDQANSQGIQGAVQSTKNKTPEVIDQIKTKAQEISEHSKKKVQEVKEDHRTQETMNRIQTKADQLKEQVKQKAQEARESSEDIYRRLDRKKTDIKNDQRTHNAMEALKLQAEKLKEKAERKSSDLQNNTDQQAQEYRSKNNTRIQADSIPIHEEYTVLEEEILIPQENSNYRVQGALGGSKKGIVKSKKNK